MFAKHKGKATTENKYDLPPPVDKVIYYGSMALVNFNVKDGDETDVTDFTSKEWEKIYDYLLRLEKHIIDEDLDSINEVFNDTVAGFKRT